MKQMSFGKFSVNGIVIGNFGLFWSWNMIVSNSRYCKSQRCFNIPIKLHHQCKLNIKEFTITKTNDISDPFSNFFFFLISNYAENLRAFQYGVKCFFQSFEMVIGYSCRMQLAPGRAFDTINDCPQNRSCCFCHKIVNLILYFNSTETLLARYILKVLTQRFTIGCSQKNS